MSFVVHYFFITVNADITDEKLSQKGSACIRLASSTAETQGTSP
jgi:hypothetical protein